MNIYRAILIFLLNIKVIYCLAKSANTSDHVPSVTLTKCNDNNYTGAFWRVPVALQSSSHGVNSEVIFTLKSSGTRLKCKTATEVQLNLTGDNEQFFTTSGFFYSGLAFLSTKGYCIKSISAETVTIEICNSSCGQNSICIQKCCPSGMVIVRNDTASGLYPKYSCYNVDDSGQSLTNITRDSLDLKYIESNEKFFELLGPANTTGLPECEGGSLVGESIRTNVSTINEFIMEMSDQILSFLSFPPTTDNEKFRYEVCVDGFEDLEDFGNDSRPLFDNIMLKCLLKQTDNAIDIDENLRMIFLKVFFSIFFFSSFCLLLTVVVYVLLWPEQNVHGWTIAVFSLSKFLYFSFQTVTLGISLFLSENLITNTPICVIIAVSIHFFGVATFSWLNMLTLDIWLTIRSMTALSERSRGKKLFINYCCYGFGVPLTIISISWVIQIFFTGKGWEGVIGPSYGQNSCYFSNNSDFYYKTLVWFALFLINIGLAILIVKFLRSSLQGNRRVNHSSTKRHKSQAMLIIKLMFLMGLPWSGEFITAFIPGEKAIWIGLAWEFLLAIEGVIIFWIFVCQKKILKQLCKKYSNVKSKE